MTVPLDADAVYVLVPPGQRDVAPAEKEGVPTLGVTVTLRVAVVFGPQVPEAVARTTKLEVTPDTTPVVALMEAPPDWIL